MLSDLILGAFLGLFGGLIVLMFLAGLIWVVWWIVNKDYKYRVRVRNMTGGKAVVEWHKAKKIKHPLLGEAYYIPSLKSQNRPHVPFLGSQYELPMRNKWYVPVTFYDGEYVPEEFDPFTQTIEREVIKEIKPLVFEKILEKVRVFILRPVPKSIRKWVLDADKVANEENPIKLSWFERNKEFIAIVILLIIVGIVCFIMILFSFQYGVEVINNAPQTPAWAIDLLNASINQSMGAPPNI